MSTSAPAQENKAASPSRMPPEEQFWKRYSAHGEAPLSLAGSVALHVLVGVGLILFALYIVSLFSNSTGTLPVEPVRFEKTGGGGGKPTGSGDGPGVGQGKEDVGEPDKENQPGEEAAPRRPNLKAAETAKLKDFDPSEIRYFQKSETGKALARLEESAGNKLRDGLNPGKGKGGRGSDGGKDTGKGKGEGPGTGAGKATLNKREKRMLRWHMRFTANNGFEYLSQLKALGAILAFPVEVGKEPKYLVAHNLVPGGKLAEEDLSSIQRIYWIDDNPKSVRDILGALRAPRMARVPSHFVAFMPEELEKQLFEMERRYVEKVLRKKFDEDRIDETQFRVVPTGRGYRPELISVSMH